MLTFEEYKNGWENARPSGFCMGGTPMPPYIDYVKREIYRQDYLDLFIGKITYKRMPIASTKDRYQVKIKAAYFEGCPEQNIVDDFVLIDVEYDYPWKAELDVPTALNRKIKYIMIGEAPPAPKVDPKKEYSFKIGKYFYDCKHIGNTNWLTSPYKALVDSWPGIKTRHDKAKVLLALADAGYYLIDVYPYALKYTSNLRDKLNKSGVTEHFFSDVTVKPELVRLAKITPSVLTQEPIIAFSGPAVTHHYIAGRIAGLVGGAPLVLPSPYVCMSTVNYIGTVVPLSSPIHGRITSPPWGAGMLNGKYAKPTGSALKTHPYYRCCTHSASGGGPHELFIRNAFDL